MTEEIWKDIKGYEGLYQVSNLGRVRMMDVWVNRHYKKGCKLVCQLKGHIEKPRSQDGGTVRLRRGVEANFRIDKLVASHFMDDYKDGMIIVHIDGCTFNNAVTNLRLSLPETYANEEWKDIQGFEGRYQISNMGRVRSLDRWTNNERPCFLKGRMLNPSMNKGKGYLRVSLSDGSRNYTHYEVHRLVALHFVPGYKPGLIVNHINEIKTDNRASNLEWCTFQYNINYSDNVACRRRPVYQYTMEGDFVAKHKCCADAEKMMGAYQGAMVHVMYESKIGKWKGYRWSFEPRTKEYWQAHSIKGSAKRRRVNQYDLNMNYIRTYNSMKEAAADNGVTVGCIHSCCHKESTIAKKYLWRYAD